MVAKNVPRSHHCKPKSPRLLSHPGNHQVQAFYMLLAYFYFRGQFLPLWAGEGSDNTPRAVPERCAPGLPGSPWLSAKTQNPAGSVTISTSFQGGTRSTSWFLTIVGVQAADVKTCQHLGFENTHQHMRAPRGCSVPQYHRRKQTGSAWLPRHRISKASVQSE